MQNIWFTADTHFNHFNIIKYNQRPFESAEEMNKTLIDNINAVVQSGDILYHLGDFSFGPRNKSNNAQHYLDQINCKNIILITGNHDPHYSNGTARPEFAALFSGGVYSQLRIKVMISGEKQEIVLNHYAMRVWNKSHYGAWHLFGHSHGTLSDDPNSLSLDVGMDAHNYQPVSLSQVAEIMETKNFIPIDHHGH